MLTARWGRREIGTEETPAGTEKGLADGAATVGPTSRLVEAPHGQDAQVPADHATVGVTDRSRRQRRILARLSPCVPRLTSEIDPECVVVGLIDEVGLARALVAQRRQSPAESLTEVTEVKVLAGR